MQVNISKIINTKGASLPISFYEKVKETERIPVDVVLAEPISFIGEVTNLGNLFEVKGSLEAKILINCARCVKPVERNLNFEVMEQFFNQISEVQDDEAYFFEGNEIFLDEMIVSNILIHLPMKVTCSNEQTCLTENKIFYGTDTEEDEDIDPRLLVLKKLFQED